MRMRTRSTRSPCTSLPSAQQWCTEFGGADGGGELAHARGASRRSHVVFSTSHQHITETMKSSERDELIALLKARFEKNMYRHRGVAWAEVEARLEGNLNALRSLRAMEASGGEPDVIGYETSEHITFCDCSPQSPTGRRSLCYDKEALDSRKEHKPHGSAAEMATEMGIELLTERQYRELQQLDEFDIRTSSWVQTPLDIRALGGALFCDRRYGKVFVYHNGAQSYYASRGFRGQLRV